MNKIKKGVLFILTYFGVYPLHFFANISGLIPFMKDQILFRKMLKSKYPNWGFSFYPILTDIKDQSGKARGQYFYQDLHVANLIYKANPKKHIDVGSRIDGFIAHLASFRKVDVMDIRPLDNDILNVNFIRADLMKPMDKFKNATDSLSCLHSIEHFGLGRYGDTIDVDGHIKGLNGLYDILEPNGLFYFSTQIGPSRIEFNAHRIFDLNYLLSIFKDKYSIENFSYIDDKDNLHTNVVLDDEMISLNCGCKMGCGIFVLRKNS